MFIDKALCIIYQGDPLQSLFWEYTHLVRDWVPENGAGQPHDNMQ